MAIGGAVSVAAVRHMHSTVERETDQLKNADANGKIGVSAVSGRVRALHAAALVVETYTPLRDLPTVPMHGLGTCVRRRSAAEIYGQA